MKKETRKKPEAGAVNQKDRIRKELQRAPATSLFYASLIADLFLRDETWIPIITGGHLLVLINYYRPPVISLC